MLNPGSPAAVEKGCRCPRESNQDGQGTFRATGTPIIQFMVQKDCPMHGETTWPQES